MGGSKFYGIYLWVAILSFLHGGFGGAPPRKLFRNMKCSRSDSRPILAYLGLVVK